VLHSLAVEIHRVISGHYVNTIFILMGTYYLFNMLLEIKGKFSECKFGSAE